MVRIHLKVGERTYISSRNFPHRTDFRSCDADCGCCYKNGLNGCYSRNGWNRFYNHDCRRFNFRGPDFSPRSIIIDVIFGNPFDSPFLRPCQIESEVRRPSISQLKITYPGWCCNFRLTQFSSRLYFVFFLCGVGCMRIRSTHNAQRR